MISDHGGTHEQLKTECLQHRSNGGGSINTVLGFFYTKLN